MLRVSPAGLAAAPVANQLVIQATYKECLCNPFCISSSAQPYANVEYSLGTAILNGTSVFVPVTARILIATPGCCESPSAYTEQFYVAFEGQTALPASVTIESAGRIQNPSDVECGVAYAYSINDVLRIVLTPATPAAGG